MRFSISILTWLSLILLVILIFAAESMQPSPLPPIEGVNYWDWLFFGAGLIFLISELVAIVDQHSGSLIGGRVVMGIVLVGLGITAIFNIPIQLLWPAALIVVGGLALIRSIFS
jgi:hypothetical protein